MTAWLVTGTNRGLGLSLVQRVLLRRDTTVIACIRDLTLAGRLQTLTVGPRSRLIVAALDSTDPDGASALVRRLIDSEGINRLDVVLANAGICDYFGLASITPWEQYLAHFATNTLGPLRLFLATLNLLRASSAPKLVGLSSSLGSCGNMEAFPMPTVAYGCSKAALNFCLRKIHFEHPELTTFSIDPGWVATDTGNRGARIAGLQRAPITVKESSAGILRLVSRPVTLSSSADDHRLTHPRERRIQVDSGAIEASS